MSLDAQAALAGCLDSLQEAAWLVDAQSHRILFANAAAAQLAQRAAADFAGLHVLEVSATPEDQAFWSEPFDAIRHGMESVTSLLLPSGGVLPVNRRVSAFSVSAAGGNDFLLVTMVDRSARHAGEKALEQLLAQLRATLDSAADGMLVEGCDGKIRAFNQKFAEMWKLPGHLCEQGRDGEIAACMFAAVCDPENYGEQLRTLAGRPSACETHLITLRDKRTLERRSVPQIHHGSVIGRVYSFRDITLQLQWQAELGLAAQVFDCSADAIFIADSAHRLLRVNPAGQRLFGQSLGELQGCHVETLLKPASAAIASASASASSASAEGSLSAQAESVWKRGSRWHGDVMVPCADGKLCAAHLSWMAVQDAKGQRDTSFGFLRDLTEQRFAQKKIHELVYSDALTGLPNRLLLNQQVQNAMASKAPGTACFAVLFLDIDRFKIVNDSLGHVFGDKVLKLVADRLQSCLSVADILCRRGGDEFVIYLDGENADSKDPAAQPLLQEKAAAMARYILEKMRQPFTLEGISFSIQCSVGIALSPQDGQTLDELIKHADTAMYRVKEQGRGSYGFYQPQMDANLLLRMQMEHSMRQALAQGNMVVYYQPQVCLKTYKITGTEALLRWTDPDLGSVSPGVFIALAEETGYILTLGAWVLEQAVKQAACWVRAGNPMTVSVNVSALEFRQDGFVQTVVRLLQLHGLSGEMLELELTESILLQDASEAAERLAALAALNVALVIDDFGTGYSSLAYLKNLPIRKLKIDQSFVRGLPDDGGDRAIVSAIVHMGHALGMQVVAEGVEQQVQCAVLAALGCDSFQGYLCAPALAPAAFDALLPSWNTAALKTSG